MFFTSDLAGRLVKRELPDDTEESFEYDAQYDPDSNADALEREALRKGPSLAEIR